MDPGVRRDDGGSYSFSFASFHSASISASDALSIARPCAASARSMWPKRRSNLALVPRSACSGSAPTCRARLTSANRRSPVSSAELIGVAAIEGGFDLVGLLANLVQHRARIVPVEADG